VAIATFRKRLPAPVRALIEIAVMLAFAFACAEGVQSAIAKPFRIPSGSMEPTLRIGQRVLVNRFIYHLQAPRRGDIVVFHPPADLSCGVAAPPGSPCPRARGREAGTYFIKRIVGLPGERIAVSDGHPVIDGHLLTSERYIRPCGGGDGCELPGAITVPKGTYFVMGDNRGDSDDSRFWGPVPAHWLVGEAFFTYWPPDRVGGL